MALPPDGQETELMRVPQSKAGAPDDAHAMKPTPSIRLVIRAKLKPQDEPAESVELQAHWRPVPLILAAVVMAIVAAGIYIFVSRAMSPAENGVVDMPRARADAARSKTRVTPAPQPLPTQSQALKPSVPPPSSSVPEARDTASESPAAINEVVPVVPRSASETIRGTIRVSVRVTVNADGAVETATSQDPGPSRYFERLSLDAAGKWKFARVDDGEKRTMLLKFGYTRGGATASASPIQ